MDVWLFGCNTQGWHKNNTLHTIVWLKEQERDILRLLMMKILNLNCLKGILRFYDSEKEFKDDAIKAQWLEQEGMEWQILNPSEVEDLEPAFKNNKNAKKLLGIYTKSDASGDIHKFCVNLKRF